MTNQKYYPMGKAPTNYLQTLNEKMPSSKKKVVGNDTQSKNIHKKNTRAIMQLLLDAEAIS